MTSKYILKVILINRFQFLMKALMAFLINRQIKYNNRIKGLLFFNHHSVKATQLNTCNHKR